MDTRDNRPLGIRYAIWGVMVWILILSGGCATVDPSREWESLATQTAGLPEAPDLFWIQDENGETKVKQTVDELLEGGLSESEAIRLALINNARLQAAFEEIGMYKADLVEAGLFENPRLAALLRWPIVGDEDRVNLELAVTMQLTDLWRAPRREQAAAAAMERILLDMGHMIRKTRKQARDAYIRVIFLGEIREKVAALLQSYKNISGATVRRREFGYMTDLDVYMARDAVTGAEIELWRADMELLQEKAHLSRILGIGERGRSIKLTDIPKSDGALKLSEHELVELALNNRLDIRAARARINEARKLAALEKASLIKEVRVGANWEHEASGTQLFGPELEMELPVFNRNQAGIARAEYLIRQARKNLTALESEVREEILHDLDRIRFLEEKARQIREKILPLRKQSLAFASQWSSLMQVSALLRLEAQKGLFEAQKEEVQTRMELQLALSDLDYHTGGPANHGTIKPTESHSHQGQ